jgi:hypothetical protein
MHFHIRNRKCLSGEILKPSAHSLESRLGIEKLSWNPTMRISFSSLFLVLIAGAGGALYVLRRQAPPSATVQVSRFEGILPSNPTGGPLWDSAEIYWKAGALSDAERLFSLGESRHPARCRLAAGVGRVPGRPGTPRGSDRRPGALPGHRAAISGGGFPPAPQPPGGGVRQGRGGRPLDGPTTGGRRARAGPGGTPSPCCCRDTAGPWKVRSRGPRTC